MSNKSTISNIQNPINILQQPKAKLTTNVFMENSNIGSNYIGNDKNVINTTSNIKTTPFIPDIQKEIELTELNDNANKIITDNYNKNITSSIRNISFRDLHKNISISCVDLLDDALNKPNEIMWGEYIQIILQKNQRYTYVGFLLIFLAIFILLVTN